MQPRLPTIELSVYDDTSNAAEGARLAHEIGGGDALLVLGPGTTAMALNEGPIYSDAGLVAIGPSTTGDRVTDPENFFRAIFSTSDAGEILASYLRYDLGGRRAIVLMKDDSYGHAVADGFKSAADWLGVAAEFHPYKTAEEAEAVAGLAAADPANPAIVLAAYDLDTLPVLKALKRQGARGPTSAAFQSPATHIIRCSRRPEERQTPGFFTEGVYAESPVVFDSSNAETLAFADRFRERFGRPPTLWAAQGYEAARLAVAAVRATAGRPALPIWRFAGRRSAPTSFRSTARRTECRASTDRCGSRPSEAVSRRSAWDASRAGNSCRRRRLVPVRSADALQIKSGAVVEIGPTASRGASRLSTPAYFSTRFRGWMSPSRHSRADFYLWMRFARGFDALASIRPTSSSRSRCAAV